MGIDVGKGQQVVKVDDWVIVGYTKCTDPWYLGKVEKILPQQKVLIRWYGREKKRERQNNQRNFSLCGSQGL